MLLETLRRQKEGCNEDRCSIRTIFSRDMRFDMDKVQRSADWTMHQLAVRRELWPEDAGGPEERMERAVIAALVTKGTLSLSRLRNCCHVERAGSGGREMFGRAIQSLERVQEIARVGRNRKGSVVYGLVESTPTGRGGQR